jgi:adenosylcobinamide-GDP ribazoletransferase
VSAAAPRGDGLTDEMTSAVRMLTTLPLPRSWSLPSTGRAFFPAVGLLVGGLAWLGCWVGSTVIDAAMGAFLAIAILVLLTGALHLDGFGDCADGLFGGSTRERRLEIMRDSRVGAFGAVAIAMILVGDILALGAVPEGRAALALLGAAALARLAMVAVILWLPYARPEGLGKLVAEGRWRRDLLLGAVAVAIPIAFDWRHGLIAVGLVTLTTLGFGSFARLRIGGATGDVYGATLELAQFAALSAYAVRL